MQPYLHKLLLEQVLPLKQPSFGQPIRELQNLSQVTLGHFAVAIGVA
ncbi:MAG: hypothetical protein KME16_01000 [Scytolyngbya sp. HA4215-MV1]|nr:hypothetical protein [Scytolyngbya sp. HA4215-MV1]